LLLPEYHSLNELLAFLHQIVREEGAIDAVVGPAADAVADTDSDLGDEEGVLRVRLLVLGDLVPLTHEDELIILRLDGHRFKSLIRMPLNRLEAAFILFYLKIFFALNLLLKQVDLLFL
jgi:hypothetical protein